METPPLLVPSSLAPGLQNQSFQWVQVAQVVEWGVMVEWVQRLLILEWMKYVQGVLEVERMHEVLVVEWVQGLQAVYSHPVAPG